MFGKPVWLVTGLMVLVISCRLGGNNREGRLSLDTLKTERLASGVTYNVMKRHGIPLIVRMVTYDRVEAHAEIKLGMAKRNGKAELGYLDPVKKISKDNKAQNEEVLAAVNAGMFFTSNGRPVGLFIRNNEVVNIPVAPIPRYLFFVSESGKMDIDRYSFECRIETKKDTMINISMVNRFNRYTGTAFLNHYFPVSSSGVSSGLYLIFHPVAGYAVNRPYKIVVDSIKSGPFRSVIDDSEGVIVARHEYVRRIRNNISIGDTLRMTVNLIRNGPAIKNAMEGWPPIEFNGRNLIRLKASGLKYGWLFAHLPVTRTAMGVSKDGRYVYIVVVDGPADWNVWTAFKEVGRWAGLTGKNKSLGIGLSALSDLMHQMGSWQAINLDGGSSTVMLIHGKQVSNPDSKVQQRPVANALLLIRKK